MATPETVDAVVDFHRMELAVMRRRARRDGIVTHHEAIEIFEYEERHLEPRLADLTSSFRFINSVTRGSRGINGPRVQRSFRELTARPANVVDFPESGIEDDGAA